MISKREKTVLLIKEAIKLFEMVVEEGKLEFIRFLKQRFIFFML